MTKKVLLVEDNEIEREGLATILRKEGYAVTPVPNGADALESAHNHAPDLVLLDMLMTTTDGWKFLEERRRDPQLRGVPVIIVTGLTVASDQWARSLGATDLVRKPIDLQEMLQKIHKYHS